MKNKTYVALIYPVDNSLTFVTHVDSHDHSALWEAGKPALAMSKTVAEDVYFGLRLNGYKANILTMPAYEEPRNPAKEEWFGIVRWCDEDIESALADHGYAASPENVAIIREQCNHSAFREGMVETGWNYIWSYIDQNRHKLTALEEEVI